MTKKEFYKSLTPEQKKVLEYLLEDYYVKGYNEGKIDTIAVDYYERY